MVLVCYIAIGPTQFGGTINSLQQLEHTQLYPYQLPVISGTMDYLWKLKVQGCKLTSRKKPEKVHESGLRASKMG